ncbi:MAG: DUF3991 domain-containing protein [bacterium]
MRKLAETFFEIKYKADLVRRIDLVSVLSRTGCVRDKYDRAKWHTSQGVISVSGTKFMNWTKCLAGGGAIDLVIHLKGVDFKTAVLWLADTFPSCDTKESAGMIHPSRPFLQLPEKDNARLSQIINYLTGVRSVPAPLIKSLIHSGKLYADHRGNAVFLLLGKEKNIVGAELRGTSHIRWQGMAHGSRKDLGCFCVSHFNTRKMVLCESAIDAISLFVLYPNCMAVSTSGATPNPAWLKSFINNGYEIFCGFDSDETGENLAKKMILLHPTIKRLKPCKHDWNEVLMSNG